MVRRPLGKTGLLVTPLGFGAFKIGRNERTHHPEPYSLPSDDEVDRLISAVLDAGITYIDTAPAYGSSEERLGRALKARGRSVVISTKVGEEFAEGRSTYDFSAAAVRASVHRSLRRLRRDALDLVFVHAPPDDAGVLSGTRVVATLQALKREGMVRAIGWSGRTAVAARRALEWADALMVEYHLEDRSHGPLVQEASDRGVGVVIKKALASGRLEPRSALELALHTRGVTSVVVGSLDAEHIRANARLAEALLPPEPKGNGPR
jgi:aryl-alcohol dehydrogenase-like predicted oxidoreductase